MNQSCSCQPVPQPQQFWIQAVSVSYTAAHGNAECLTHSVRPGIEPASSWRGCGVLNQLSHSGKSCILYIILTPDFIFFLLSFSFGPNLFFLLEFCFNVYISVGLLNPLFNIMGYKNPSPFFFFFDFYLFRAVPLAYGGCQARGLVEAVATGLRHSHSNARSEPRLRLIPQLTAMPDP